MTSFWTGDRVARALRVDVDAGAAFSGVGTDTRKLEAGALFVALVGDRFDAHDFLGEALRRGARGAVVRRGTARTEGLLQIEVEDTLMALGLLARERRRAVTGPVVAVTGTNGKTSTKEMLARGLATRWKVHATEQNLNNLIGVPLTILAAPADSEALVVEAAANQPGEIARLRDIIEPSVGVVTNVSAGHLAGFRSLAGALDEKTALLAGVPVAVVGTKPEELASRARELTRRVVTAGLDAGDVRPDAWGVHDDGRGWCSFRGRRFRLPIVGVHQLANASVVLAVAVELGLDLDGVAEALGSFSLPPGRCDVLRHGGSIIVQDTYNANPASVTALLATARAMRAGRPLVVMLGSMLELGDDSERLHAEVADQVMDADPRLVAVLGEFVGAFAHHAPALGESLITAADAPSLGRALASRLAGGELILVKGSRGVHMERAVPYLVSSDEAPCSTIS